MTDESHKLSHKFGKNKLIEISLKLFYWFGLWPSDDSTIGYYIFALTFHIFTSVGWTIGKSIATTMLETKSELILLIPTTFYAYTNLYRGFLILWKSEAIKTALRAISDLQLTKNEYDAIQPKITFFNRMSLAYTTFISLGLISTFLNPVVSNGKDLPVPIWLPYNNWKENRVDYIIALLFSYAGISSITISCAFTPIFVWYLIFINSLKFEIYGQRLRNLGCEESNSFEELLNSVRRHREIVLNVKEVEDIFANVFLYQIGTSAICICSIAYLMASDPIVGNSNNFMMYVGLGGIYIYEIFVLIYYANEIALDSDQLSFHIYESNWINMPITYQKIMIIMVETWKKPQQLVVGKVFPMRINILTSILNVAYSILNVLRKGQP